MSQMKYSYSKWSPSTSPLTFSHLDDDSCIHLFHARVPQNPCQCVGVWVCPVPQLDTDGQDTRQHWHCHILTHQAHCLDSSSIRWLPAEDRHAHQMGNLPHHIWKAQGSLGRWRQKVWPLWAPAFLITSFDHENKNRRLLDELFLWKMTKFMASGATFHAVARIRLTCETQLFQIIGTTNRVPTSVFIRTQSLKLQSQGLQPHSWVTHEKLSCCVRCLKATALFPTYSTSKRLAKHYMLLECMALALPISNSLSSCNHGRMFFARIDFGVNVLCLQDHVFEISPKSLWLACLIEERRKQCI